MSVRPAHVHVSCQTRGDAWEYFVRLCMHAWRCVAKRGEAGERCVCQRVHMCVCVRARARARVVARVTHVGTDGLELVAILGEEILVEHFDHVPEDDWVRHL